MTQDKHPTSGDSGLDRTACGPARCIVCEQSGRWAIGLRRVAGGLRVHETRSLADAWDMLANFPASFLVLELTAANAEVLVERLARLERDFPSARAAVVAGHALVECEELVREAGAVCFVASPRELEPLAGSALRHLQSVPVPQRDLATEIWQRLPWGREEG